MAVKKTVAKKPVVTKSRTAPRSKPSSSSPEKSRVTAPSPAKKPVGRPRKQPIPAPPVQEQEPEYTPLSREACAKNRIQGMNYLQLEELTGIRIETEAFQIALELLRGGRDRQEINDRVRDLLPSTTAAGTRKPVPNLVSGVLKKLQFCGFTIKGDWKVVKPSPRV